MRHILLKLVFICFIGLTGLNAQKVGLVLSGGGAKGLAHLGVLHALEEHDIPIDYITGTSMGGLIGGFYAAGYNVGDLENILYSQNFQNWVNGKNGDAYNFYFSSRKEQADWVSFNLNVDSGFHASLETNLANDLPLNFALAEWLATPSQRANYNFDSLFIPFRAIASEIFTQKSVSLQQGPLNNALRATMTVPFFYRPIKIDGVYLFDGGIYNNYPLDVMEDTFEPDIILGVNVSVKRYKEYPFEDADRLMKSSLLRMILDKPETDAYNDKLVYIEPDLQRYTSFDFKEVHALVEEGYKAAIRQMPEIKAKIAERISCEDRAVTRNDFLEAFKPLMIDQVSLQGFNPSQEQYIKRNFKRRDGNSISISDARYKYYKLVSESYFNSIYPEIVFNEETDSFELRISNQGKSKLDVDFGGNISTRNISTIYLGMYYSHLNYMLFNHHANFYTGRFYNSANYRLRLNLPSIMPMFFETYTTYNNYDFLSTSQILTERTNPKAVKSSEFVAGSNMAFPIGIDKRFKFRYAYFDQRTRFSNVYNFIATDTLDRGIQQGSRFGVLLEHSSLNRKMYPSKGLAYRLTADFVMARFTHEPGSTAIISEGSLQSNNWLRAKAGIEQYHKLNRLTLGYQAEAVLSNQPLYPTYWASITHYDQYNALNDSPTLFLEQFRARSYVAGGVRLIYPILSNLEWRNELHAFKPIRRLSQNTQQQPELSSLVDLQVSAAAYTALIYHSPVGPIALSANYHDDVRQRLTFMLHIGFILFNQSAFD